MATEPSCQLHATLGIDVFGSSYWYAQKRSNDRFLVFMCIWCAKVSSIKQVDLEVPDSEADCGDDS